MAYASWHTTVTDLQGNVIPNASIYVVDESTGIAPQLYADRQGLVPMGNPFTAEADGTVNLYVAGGAYRIRASFGAWERTWRYVGIGTAQEYDAEAIIGRSVSYDPQTPTSAEQAQARANTNALGGITLAARRAIITDASGNLSQTSLTDFARSILDDANGAAMFETMGAAKTHAETGYAKNPDGTVTQWGSSVLTTASEVNDIFFPVTFPTGCAMVVVCNGDTTIQGGTIFGVHAKYSDRFTLRTNGHSGTVRANWIAMGF